MSSYQVDELGKHIIEALQVNGRASWRKIATALEVPERTVARYGTALLQNGLIDVVGLHVQQMHALVEISTIPGASNLAVEALARRIDTSFSYKITGRSSCIAEFLGTTARLGDVFSLELPAINGVTEIEVHPVLTYFQTTASWRVGLLSDTQVARLEAPYRGVSGYPLAENNLSAQDQQILASLTENGRASYESIARTAGISESTARRRTEQLLATNILEIRTVVEPTTLGYGIQAFLWVQAKPEHIQDISSRLVEYQCVRYAAAIAGTHQIVADVVFQDLHELYNFTTSTPWSHAADAIKTSITVGSRKRGGRITNMPDSAILS